MLVPLLLFACRPEKPTDPADPTVGDADTDTDTDSDTDTDTDTDADTDTGLPIGWNGEGHYRVRVTVPGYDPGGRADQGPAETRLDFGPLLAELGVTDSPDPATFQLVREAEDGTPLAPATPPADPLGAWDVPYRFTDQPLRSQGYVFNVASAEEYGTLSFVHTQDGAGDTLYSLYFDVTPDPWPVSSPRPLVGDGDMLYEPEGWLGTMIHTRPFVVDLDGDGLLDLVTGDSLGYVTLYRNHGTATEPLWTDGEWLLSDDGGPIQDGYLSIPCVVDWDGDGDLDLLVGSETGAIIHFYRDDGGGLYSDQGLLTADGETLQIPPVPCAELEFFEVDYTAATEAVDWDGDGDLDLLIGGYVTGHIFFYENVLDGPGEPVLRRGPDLEADGAPIDTWWSASPVTVDLDDDGDLDLLSGTMNWEPTVEEATTWPWVFYWENVDGALTERTLPMTAELPVTRGNLTGVRPGDLDADGDADLVVATDSRVYVLRNVGDATNPLFTPEDPLRQRWTPLLTSADAEPADLDGDGDLDFSRGGGASVSWTRNTGGGDPPSFEGQASIAAADGVIVHTFEDGDDTSFPTWVDWDRDGDLDLVMGAGDGLVWLYRNTGTDPVTDLAAGEQLFLTDGTLLHVGEARSPEDFAGHSGDRAQPAAADLDGDGDTDLFVGDAYGSVTMFLNAGDDRFAAGEALLHRDDNRVALSVADWDDDGDTDLLVGQGSTVAIYENDGGPNAFQLGQAETVATATIYYPHPYPGDLNGDGDLDLVISSSYYYDYYVERTWIERGTQSAVVTAIGSVDGTEVAVVPPEPTDTYGYEADTLPSYATPAWTPYPDEGAVSDGVLTIGSLQSILLGSLFGDAGGEGWVGSDTTEVELRIRVLSIGDGESDSISIGMSDGANNWHVRLAPDGMSVYSYPTRYPVDTADWHTWRFAMNGATLAMCLDDDPAQTWESEPSFTYARNALWIGDDGTGTGGSAQIDWIRWSYSGDGDPCTEE